MLNRRSVVAGLAALPVVAGMARAQTPAAAGLRMVPIGASGLSLPAIGLGTARRYENPVGDEQMAPLSATIARFAELGAKVVDTAPSYGRAEEVLGTIVARLGIRDQLFLATKVGADSPEAGKAQIEQSFRNLRTDRIDLIEVHNLRDIENQLAILRELKAANRIRLLGMTTSSKAQYDPFEQVLRRQTVDTIQIDYALDNRSAADRILPLAQEKGVAVLINLPFGRDRLFAATQGKALPDWAKEIGVTTWAQLFLKYVISHPSRPIAIPGMSQAKYVDDNLGAARGPLPDAAMRRRMEQYIDAL